MRRTIVKGDEALRHLLDEVDAGGCVEARRYGPGPAGPGTPRGIRRRTVRTREPAAARAQRVTSTGTPRRPC
ncbi:hypothetical protein HUT17_04200 [Nocardiopsis flavescens]|nr:hypothetical protein HUT17_04200 [Nocardiopsis flavescens]